MSTLRDIRKRIKSVKGSQKITQAMKLVAAAKFRKAQDAILTARPYAKGIENLLQHFPQQLLTQQLLLKSRPVQKLLLVVVTSDKGLCGAFNSNIIRRARRLIESFLSHKEAGAPSLRFKKGGSGQRSIQLYCIGRRGREFFRKHSTVKLVDMPFQLQQTLHAEDVFRLSLEFANMYQTQQFDEVVILYNNFHSAIRQEVVEQPFLPIVLPKETTHAFSDQKKILYEPSEQHLIERLLPRLLSIQLLRVLLESQAAEHGARMTAMDAASKNARELVEHLTLQYNRARQANITRELMDIVGGAEALNN